MEVQKKADPPARVELINQPALLNTEITDFYLDYTYTTGYGVATVHFTNNTDNAALFQIELKSGSSTLGWQTANVSANSGVYIGFTVSVTSGTLTAKVTKGTTTVSTSCSIYNATTNPSNPTYKATALATNPVFTLKYYTNPTNMWKYCTPELTWTAFSNVIPNTSDMIYAAVRYPSTGGSCLYPQYLSNDVRIEKISFNSVSNEIYICKPDWVEYTWSKKQFTTDTAKWTRVYISW
ncbi:hypothetical protein [Chitinophaga qingshengii]|uniref:Uncharacterized protein n=1 Tax=Chitinophaga qingshengii TaxID=1569794 RepID=A0ABR7TXT1_9BACT|nr:hypothetical protein [Chitinophaga qingshengii]MBC9934878.1 hypothetical protein [Chitinophaga qingshengii]